jgi:hypothetical protein
MAGASASVGRLGAIASSFGIFVIVQRKKTKSREELALSADWCRAVIDEEYRLLVGRVDEIYADETRKGEVEAINALLLAKDKTKR